ncbi:scaffolding protein [Mycobacterium phage Zetzy]|uniref:Scaffolding protein n=1 Tax=Mycobacterium phage Zetzy TaxID=2499071 RepID=A0A3S9UNQ4_9CAUD|nr:head scaffolding protein [Mycobacterium phage Zetzy]AZS11985.1 scaffolding protein [Mycobacterium phage Zetzy]
MSDTPTTTETQNAADQGQEPKVETFSRDYVEELRRENAGLRVSKKEAVEAAKAEVIREYEAKAAEKDTTITELQTSLSDRDLELLKIKAVLGAEVPTEDVLDVVSLIQGTDEDSVSESVKRVKALLGKAPAKSPAFDPTQGSGSHIPLNGNPLLDALKRAVGA